MVIPQGKRWKTWAEVAESCLRGASWHICLPLYPGLPHPCSFWGQIGKVPNEPISVWMLPPSLPSGRLNRACWWTQRGMQALAKGLTVGVQALEVRRVVCLCTPSCMHVYNVHTSLAPTKAREGFGSHGCELPGDGVRTAQLRQEVLSATDPSL